MSANEYERLRRELSRRINDAPQGMVGGRIDIEDGPRTVRYTVLAYHEDADEYEFTVRMKRDDVRQWAEPMWDEFGM